MAPVTAGTTPVVEEETVRVPAIKALCELNRIANADLCQVLWGSYELIFAYRWNDIVENLEKRDATILKEIRQFLCEEAGKLFPEYETRTPVNRNITNKKGISLDIYNLGYSIINKSVSIDMENVYQKKKVTPEEVNGITTAIDTTDQLSNLLLFVSKMETSVSEMRMDIENNKKEIMSLKMENRGMVEKLKICKCVDTNVTTASDVSVNVLPNVLVPNAFGTAFSTTVDTEPPAPGVTADCNLPQGQRNQNSREPEYSQSEPDTSDSDENPQTAKQKKQSKPVERGPNPVMAGTKPEKKVEIFIGHVAKHNSVHDIWSHMKTHDIKVDISDIVEIPQMSGLKAFKVTIGRSHTVAIKSIWPDGMKVDKFKAIKTGPSGKSDRPYNNNSYSSYNNNNRQASHPRTQVRKQPFHKQAQQGNANHRYYDNHRYYNNWQGNSNHRENKNWRVNRKWQPDTGSRFSENNIRERSQQDSHSNWETPYHYSHRR